MILIFFLQSPMLQSGQNAVNAQLQKYAIQTTINPHFRYELNEYWLALTRSHFVYKFIPNEIALN